MPRLTGPLALNKRPYCALAGPAQSAMVSRDKASHFNKQEEERGMVKTSPQ
jgi:hypothetical protein